MMETQEQSRGFLTNIRKNTVRELEDRIYVLNDLLDAYETNLIEWLQKEVLTLENILGRKRQFLITHYQKIQSQKAQGRLEAFEEVLEIMGKSKLESNKKYEDLFKPQISDEPQKKCVHIKPIKIINEEKNDCSSIPRRPPIRLRRE